MLVNSVLVYVPKGVNVLRAILIAAHVSAVAYVSP
jgi:hypothetical protein